MQVMSPAPGAGAPHAHHPPVRSDLARLARRTPDLLRIWGRKRMDPKLREAVMVAVSQANGCRACSTAHRSWALRAGVTDDELAALENRDPAGFDRRTWAAVTWAQERAAALDRLAPPHLEAELERLYTHQERRDLELVADAMTLANHLVLRCTVLFALAISACTLALHARPARRTSLSRGVRSGARHGGP